MCLHRASRWGAGGVQRSPTNPFLGESCFLFSFQRGFRAHPPLSSEQWWKEHAHPCELGEGDSRQNLTISLHQ